MKNTLLKSAIFILFLCVGIIFGIYIGQNPKAWSRTRKQSMDLTVNPNSTIKAGWSNDFELDNINSTADNKLQKA